MNQETSRVVIRDDGELTDLRSLLDEIGVSYASSTREDVHIPLLVTTPRYALRLGEAPSALPPCNTHIVMASSISQTVRAQLQRFRCNYIVEENFHRTALQLLVLHSLYQGPERRKLDRVALAEPIKLKVGWRTRKATLIQLSPRGCGITGGGNCPIDTDVTLTLPKSMTGGTSMVLRARVVGKSSAKNEEQQLALVFTSLSGVKLRDLKKVMDRMAGGNSRMTPNLEIGAGTSKERPAKKTVRLSDFKFENRRKNLRGEYSERVLAAAKGSARALIGRDLSIGGMLVEPNADLVVGEQIKLILFGHSDKEPIVVHASVLRDNGSLGMALRFGELGCATQARLEELVESLPIRSSRGLDGAAIEGGQPVVVSELVQSE